MSLYRTDENWHQIDAGPSEAELEAVRAREEREAAYAAALAAVREGDGHCPLLARAVRLGHCACFWTPYPDPVPVPAEQVIDAWSQAAMAQAQEKEREAQVALLDQARRPEEWVVQTYIRDGHLPLRYRTERKELARWLETTGRSNASHKPVNDNPFAALAAWRMK